MNIKYLQHHEIDKFKWDRCVNKSFNGIIYAYSWYLDIVSKGWDAIVDGDYEAVFPITHNKKFGFNYLYQPFFTQQLGVFSVKKLTQDITNVFIEAIPSKYKLIEINLNTFNKFSTNSFRSKLNDNYELDLIPSYDSIYRAYSSNTKRNIKNALRNNVTITVGVNPQDVINIFRRNKGRFVSGLASKQYVLLLELIKKLIYMGKAQVWGAYDNRKKLCAGVFFSATNKDAKNNGAMSLLIDRYISKNSESNLTLDFEGSNNANLARFYASFGSKKCTYLSVRKNNLPWFIKWLK